MVGSSWLCHFAVEKRACNVVFPTAMFCCLKLHIACRERYIDLARTAANRKMRCVTFGEINLCLLLISIPLWLRQFLQLAPSIRQRTIRRARGSLSCAESSRKANYYWKRSCPYTFAMSRFRRRGRLMRSNSFCMHPYLYINFLI